MVAKLIWEPDPATRQGLKRIAIQVVSLLPEDEREALRVLDYAQRLVVDYLREKPHSPNLIPLNGGNAFETSGSDRGRDKASQ